MKVEDEMTVVRVRAIVIHVYSENKLGLTCILGVPMCAWAVRNSAKVAGQWWNIQIRVNPTRV